MVWYKLRKHMKDRKRKFIEHYQRRAREQTRVTSLK
jgi:hypothetical protein